MIEFILSRWSQFVEESRDFGYSAIKLGLARDLTPPQAQSKQIGFANQIYKQLLQQCARVQFINIGMWYRK